LYWRRRLASPCAKPDKKKGKMRQNHLILDKYIDLKIEQLKGFDQKRAFIFKP
tara:strand:- start:209 stop:367 length:159 start_codon:yes stop_codon:yes gene_type:complete